MNLATFKKQIISKQFNQFYILCGEETEIMWMYINQLKAKFSTYSKTVDSFLSIHRTLTNKSFLSQKTVYIVNNDMDFCKDEKSIKLLQELDNPDIVLIFTYISLDKRCKLYKEYKDDIIEFNPLDTDILIKYINREIPLNHNYCEVLCNACENSYSRILLEVDKILHYSNIKGIDVNESFEYLTGNNVVTLPENDDIFNLVDTICSRDAVSTYELLDSIISKGNQEIPLLSILYTNFKNMLIVKDAGYIEGITKATGLTGFQIKNARKNINNWEISELVGAVKLLRYIEKGIKSGTIPIELSVNYFLVTYL